PETVATSVNADVFPFADVVTTSLSKYFAGSGDVLAGAIIINSASPFSTEMRAWLRQETSPFALHPADAAVLAVASRDYKERVEAINSNAEELVGMLEKHPAIEHVFYPTRETPGLYDQIRRPNGGGGGLLSIVLKDAARTAPKFYDNLRVSKGPSFGTRFTLACPYSLLAHYPELDWAESCGVSRWLVRVGVGIETDLVGRFEKALEA
ncbi:PLP-dependent transferase, partial [Verrucomicrobiales bacterium]|nr:PLP-dependent transferase [Verrucomicrobiales bacterium]